MAGAPDIVKELVERYADDREYYRSGDYDETELRVHFINPFWTALGWDVENKDRRAPAYVEVVHEYKYRVEGVTKVPDYCFRWGEKPLFFLETKRPKVNIRTDHKSVRQLRKYGWNRKLGVSLLTNFEDLAIYDCNIRPKSTDPPGVARIEDYDYSNYEEYWDEIHHRFAYESVKKGYFDKFAKPSKPRKGTVTIDDDFLAKIEEWRKALADEIYSRNPKLINQGNIDFAVQRTIDRLIFLRMAEDRRIEDSRQLLALASGKGVYRRLVSIYNRADSKYNSGLFHFDEDKDRPGEPDRLTPQLEIPDAPLKRIIQALYPPTSMYAFDVIPTEILGHVYERFLGKVIILSETATATVEEKPEVRKAGGVYYTPEYIVDYIVDNTVGKLLEAEGMTPQKASKLRILDPACGSGSFLLGAYKCLLKWHDKHYNKQREETGNTPMCPSGKDQPAKVRQKRMPAIYKSHKGNWLLTTAEKKRILINNIYGVDLDAQAVEVSKLSLLMKVLEDENAETIEANRRTSRERALPDLSNNIKRGNSLIGPDFYKMYPDLNDEDDRRIKPFDWGSAKLGFGKIMKEGGFDAVIGNPPYVRQEGLGEFKEYLAERYHVYHGMADLYSYFIERAMSLVGKGGYFSFIVANKWMRANYGKPLRRWLKKTAIEEIIDFRDLPVFEQATTYPCIVRIAKTKPKATFAVVKAKTLDFPDLSDYAAKNAYQVRRDTLSDSEWSLESPKVDALLKKLRKTGVPLGKYIDGKIYRGVLTGLNKAFVIDSETRERLIAEDPKSEELIRHFLAGKDIKRYAPLKPKAYLIFSRRGIDINKYPAVKAHLLKFKKALLPKPPDWPKDKKWPGRKPGQYKWYEIQDTVAYYTEFEKPKITFPDISAAGAFTLDTISAYSVNTTYIIPTGDKYLLAILNSRLMNFLYSDTFATYQGGYLRFFSQYMEAMPIIPQPEQQDSIAKLAERMLDLRRSKADVKTPGEIERIDNRIAATDKEIDEIVYDLYGLTEDEIKIVERER